MKITLRNIERCNTTIKINNLLEVLWRSMLTTDPLYSGSMKVVIFFSHIDGGGGVLDWYTKEPSFYSKKSQIKQAKVHMITQRSAGEDEALTLRTNSPNGMLLLSKANAPATKHRSYHWSTLHLAVYWLANFDRDVAQKTKSRGEISEQKIHERTDAI